MKRAMLKTAFAAAVGVVLLAAGCSSESNAPPSSGCGAETACANGAGSMKACYTTDSTGLCSSLYYQVGSTTFPCVSCDDQAYCANAALVTCGVPEASIPADADLPEGAMLGSDSGDAAPALGEGGTGADGALPEGAAPDGGADSAADTGSPADSGGSDATPG